jgi:hypothetical protein
VSNLKLQEELTHHPPNNHIISCHLLPLLLLALQREEIVEGQIDPVAIELLAAVVGYH